jgi:hypothetical protein
MNTLSNENITKLATSINKAHDTQSNAAKRIRNAFASVIQAELAESDSCTFEKTLQMANETMEQRLVSCESKAKDLELPKNYRAQILQKEFESVRELSYSLRYQVKRQLNASSKLDGKRWALVQIRSTTKKVSEENYPWTGNYKIVQKATKARTPSTDTNDTTPKMVELSKQPSNSTIANVVEGKTIKQQQALFAAIAKEGELKLSAQQVLDILFGLNAYTAVDINSELVTELKKAI